MTRLRIRTRNQPYPRRTLVIWDQMDTTIFKAKMELHQTNFKYQYHLVYQIFCRTFIKLRVNTMKKLIRIHSRIKSFPNCIYVKPLPFFYYNFFCYLFIFIRFSPVKLFITSTITISLTNTDLGDVWTVTNVLSVF